LQSCPCLAATYLGRTEPVAAVEARAMRTTLRIMVGHMCDERIPEDQDNIEASTAEYLWSCQMPRSCQFLLILYKCHGTIPEAESIFGISDWDLMCRSKEIGARCTVTSPCPGQESRDLQCCQLSLQIQETRTKRLGLPGGNSRKRRLREARHGRWTVGNISGELSPTTRNASTREIVPECEILARI
jgi:hypothetical protein